MVNHYHMKCHLQSTYFKFSSSELKVLLFQVQILLWHSDKSISQKVAQTFRFHFIAAQLIKILVDLSHRVAITQTFLWS
jgi:hypothetical protein